MDEKQIVKFRVLLHQHKQSIEEISETNESAAETVELDQTRLGRLSRMDALQGQAMSIAAKNRRALELKKIDSALKRLSDDDFGYCQLCDEEIAIQRLESNPTVIHCIRCAEKLESGSG